MPPVPKTLPQKSKVFKIQKNLCAFFCQTTSGKACAHDKRTKREKERPERAVSPKPRATPWVSVYKRLRPVRAKVWANGWLLLLPLQGVGNGNMVPRALPWAMNWLPFQGVPFRTLFVYHVRMLCHLLFDQKTAHPRPAHFRHHCNTISFPFFTQGWILTMTEIYSLSKSSGLSVSGGIAG